jgi:toxin HigB-1
MIESFKNKHLEKLYLKGESARIGKQYHKNILLILDHLAAISDLKDCAGVKDFHELKGNRKGTYSMHVTGNFCITFRFENEKVFDVEFEDYH